MVLASTLAGLSRKPRNLRDVLALSLAATAGPAFRDDEIAEALAYLDSQALNIAGVTLDLAAIESEINTRKAAVDGLVAEAYGISDVSIDLLRRPGDAY